MPTYTIVTAEHKKDLQLDHGEFKVYSLILQGEDKPVELKQKAASPPPAQGMRLDGTIEDGPYGKVFKKEFQARGGFGGAPDPKREARIVRQHSQEMAIYWFEVLKRHDMLTPEQQAKGARYVIDLADFFQADAMKDRA